MWLRGMGLSRRSCDGVRRALGFVLSPWIARPARMSGCPIGAVTLGDSELRRRVMPRRRCRAGTSQHLGLRGGCSDWADLGAALPAVDTDAAALHCGTRATAAAAASAVADHHGSVETWGGCRTAHRTASDARPGKPRKAGWCPVGCSGQADDSWFASQGRPRWTWRLTFCHLPEPATRRPGPVPA